LTKDAPVIAMKSISPECEEGVYKFSHGDGYVLSTADRPKLELQIASLSELSPALGSTVEAEITLKNIDRTEIVIPWSTDPNVVTRPPDATHYEYESAGFWIWSKDVDGRREMLKSLTLPLYRSDAQPQSSLKLSAGQWVTLRIKFRLVIDEEKPSRSLTPGPVELKIEWRQARYTWERKGCTYESGYFSYSDFYDQATNPVKIFLLSSMDEQAPQNIPNLRSR
jgi:hypothetical protein